MPKIVCPRCGASVFAVRQGHTVELRGSSGIDACPVLAHSDDDVEIDDLLECPDMEKAVEGSLDDITETPAAVAWPRDGGVYRDFERWEPLNGTIYSGRQSYRCVVLDISPGGAAVWTPSSDDVPEGAEVNFEPSGHGSLPAEVVRMRGGVLGLMFLIDNESRARLVDWLDGLRQALGETAGGAGRSRRPGRRHWGDWYYCFSGPPILAKAFPRAFAPSLSCLPLIMISRGRAPLV